MATSEKILPISSHKNTCYLFCSGCISVTVLGLLHSVPLLSLPLLWVLSQAPDSVGFVSQAPKTARFWSHLRPLGGTKNRLGWKRKGETSPPQMVFMAAAASSPWLRSPLDRSGMPLPYSRPPEHTTSPFCLSNLRVLVVSLSCLTDPCLSSASPSPV